MKPSVFSKSILCSLFALIVQSSLLAQEMSRGTMLLSAFCLDTYGSEQTNSAITIDCLCERELSVSGFAVSFGQAECTGLQTNISFCATNEVGSIVASGHVEETPSPVATVHSALMGIGANSLPIFAITNRWTSIPVNNGFMLSSNPIETNEAVNVYYGKCNLLIYVNSKIGGSTSTFLTELMSSIMEIPGD